MTLKRQELRYFYNYLQNRGKWYIDIQCPDIELFQDIAEKAKAKADKVLSNMSFCRLFYYFLRWEWDDKKIVSPHEGYYNAFLDDLVWKIGRNSLNPQERRLYLESCNLILKFI